MLNSLLFALKALVNPLRRSIARDNNQHDDNQAQPNGKHILPAENSAPHPLTCLLSLWISHFSAHLPFAVFFGH